MKHAGIVVVRQENLIRSVRYEKERGYIIGIVCFALFLTTCNCFAQTSASQEASRRPTSVTLSDGSTITGITGVGPFDEHDTSPIDPDHGTIYLFQGSGSTGIAPKYIPAEFLEAWGFVRLADGSYRQIQPWERIDLPPMDQVSKDAPGNVRAFIKQLYSNDALERGQAAYDLGELGSKASAATLVLIAILPDTRSLEWDYGPVAHTLTSVRWEALHALGEIGDSRAVPPLIEMLHDDDSVSRALSALALGKIRDARSVDALIAVIEKNGWHDPVEAAATALGDIADQRAVKPLANAMNATDPTSGSNFGAGVAIIDALVKLNAIETIVDARGERGRTPLLVAVAANRKDLVELLLAKGADVNAKDDNGVTPLRRAVQGGDQDRDVAEVLRQHGGHE